MNFRCELLPVEKDALISEIEAIYRDLGYVRKGRPLRYYDNSALYSHLTKLKAGEVPITPGWKKRTTGETPVPPEQA